MKIPRVLFSFILIPVWDSSVWKTIPLHPITPNQYRYEKDYLLTAVADSSSILAHFFETPKKVKAFKVEFSVHPWPMLFKRSVMGELMTDDFAIKVCVPKARAKPYSWWERFFLPPWRKDLSQLNPPVYFESVECAVASQYIDYPTQRQHPTHKWLQETFYKIGANSGWARLERDFSTAIEGWGLWILSDGDNMHSSYQVKIKSVLLETE